MSVKTNVPTTKATPSVTASVDRTNRILCARRLRSTARNTSDRPTGGVEALHAFQHPLGSRLVHGIDDAPVTEEDDLVGVGRCAWVVRNHDDGLTEVIDRTAKETQNLAAGA